MPYFDSDRLTSPSVLHLLNDTVKSNHFRGNLADCASIELLGHSFRAARSKLQALIRAVVQVIASWVENGFFFHPIRKYYLLCASVLLS